MKGYKGMSNRMTCRGMRYEIGKTNSVDGEIVLCENGLHFCKQLKDVVRFYPLYNSRYFEVKAGGKIVSGGDKSAAGMLTIVREVSRKEINRALYSHKSYSKNCYLDIKSGDGYGNGYHYDKGNGYGYDYGNGYGDGKGDGEGNNCDDGYNKVIHGQLNEVCVGM